MLRPAREAASKCSIAATSADRAVLDQRGPDRKIETYFLACFCQKKLSRLAHQEALRKPGKGVGLWLFGYSWKSQSSFDRPPSASLYDADWFLGSRPKPPTTAIGSKLVS